MTEGREDRLGSDRVMGLREIFLVPELVHSSYFLLSTGLSVWIDTASLIRSLRKLHSRYRIAVEIENGTEG